MQGQRKQRVKRIKRVRRDQREKYENGLFTIRFIGDDFDTRGVNIYDLSHTLIAMQRIVHKAFLAQEGRLRKGAFPTIDEREKLALQLGERKRKSDAFALIPVLSDPFVQESMKQMAQYVLSGLVGYYTGKVLDTIHKEKNHDKQIFISSLYADVVNITDRVEASGGVDSIALGSPQLDRETVATFNPETKDYLRSLRDEHFLGPYQEIQGYMYKMYPTSRIIAIRRAGGNTVNIQLNDKDFQEVRYIKETKPRFIFKGHPVYQFGVETKTVTDFEADEIEYVPPEGLE